ncbi:MAG: histidine phosphatase family protein [Oscillospiraceae bacterium]|nr:histidine phosphatase family protein [Oscillospiraceae bacterium]
MALLSGKAILGYIDDRKLVCGNIYAANSLRARTTAEIISNTLDTAPVISVSEFVSLKNDFSLAGHSEEDAKMIDRHFLQELSLSRAGIFNGYRFSSNWTEKIVRLHEMTAYEKYLEILRMNEKEDLILMIMHHSSITAVLINIARQYYGYPLDFFGNVECDLCNIFLVEYEGGIANIKLANVGADELLRLT